MNVEESTVSFTTVDDEDGKGYKNNYVDKNS